MDFEKVESSETLVKLVFLKYEKIMSSIVLKIPKRMMTKNNFGESPKLKKLKAKAAIKESTIIQKLIILIINKS